MGHLVSRSAFLALALLGVFLFPSIAFYIATSHGPPGHPSICAEALTDLGTIPADKIGEIASASRIPDLRFYGFVWHVVDNGGSGLVIDSLNLIKDQRDKAVQDAYHFYENKRGASCAATFGCYLHTVQDFYAHTNWVDYHVDHHLPLTTYDMSRLPPAWLHSLSSLYSSLDKDGPGLSPLYYAAYALAVTATQEEWIAFGRRICSQYPSLADEIFQANGFPAVGAFKLAQPDSPILKSQSSTTIAWSNFVSLENIKVSLFKNGSWQGDIGSLSDPDIQHYHWTAGRHGGGDAPLGGLYQIRVATLSGSHAAFSRTFVLSGLQIIAPNGGEHWKIGTTREIRWDALGVALGAKIFLYQGLRCLGEIAAVEDVESLSYLWKVGSCLGRTAAPGPDYRIQIRSQNGKTYQWTDSSDAGFSLDL
jgi:hypothetical protein